MKIVNIVALILNIIGGINWGLVGLFRFDLVAWICGGQDSVFARIIYSLVDLPPFGASAYFFQIKLLKSELCESQETRGSKFTCEFGRNSTVYCFVASDN